MKIFLIVVLGGLIGALLGLVAGVIISFILWIVVLMYYISIGDSEVGGYMLIILSPIFFIIIILTTVLGTVIGSIGSYFLGENI